MKYILVILTFFLLATDGWSQRRPVTQNYRKFDRKLIHFGFMMGVNTADFSTRYKPNLQQEFGVYSINNVSQPGFQLGIISSMKLGTPLIRMRFIPTISFLERVLEYQFITDDLDNPFEEKIERVPSTNLDFPLLFKFRTMRYNNFAAYVITGAQYTLDLQSAENTSQSFSDPFIKLFRDDFQGQIGAGVDFFLPYFKFGLELKLSHGLINGMIQDNTRLSEPINALYNRVWWFCLTFEG
jgi:hypothetical protein